MHISNDSKFVLLHFKINLFFFKSVLRTNTIISKYVYRKMIKKKQENIFASDIVFIFECLTKSTSTNICKMEEFLFKK